MDRWTDTNLDAAIVDKLFASNICVMREWQAEAERNPAGVAARVKLARRRFSETHRYRTADINDPTMVP
jgi:hypothetical protein